MESLEKLRLSAKYQLIILHGEDNIFRLQGYSMPVLDGIRCGIWRADTRILEFKYLADLLTWVEVNYK